jgi:hypothetical protein
MQQELSRDDVVQLIEISKQNNCAYDCEWLLNLANKITNTLNLVTQLRDEIKVQATQSDRPNVVGENKTVWAGQLMYKHRGFSLPRFEDLGNFTHEQKDEAFKQAKNIANEWITQNFKENEIEHWDVRVRPLEVIGLS